MKPSKSLKTVALVSVTAAAATLFIQACGGGAVAQAASDADPVEGVWESTLTIKDCASGAVLTTFKGLAVLHRGGEDRSFKRTFSWRRAVAGRRLGWPGSSVEALSAVFVFDGHRQNADDPGRGRASEAWAEVYPDDSAALTRFCEAPAQLIPAAMGTWPPETCWVGKVRPLAAAALGPAPLAAPWPADPGA